MSKRQVKHKRIGGNRSWWTLCGSFSWNSQWRNTWKAVTCKRCRRLKGTDRDFLEKESR
jgi:hypothetical protein